MKEGLAIPRSGATSMRLLIQSIWADLRYGLKEDSTEIVGDIVVVCIRR